MVRNTYVLNCLNVGWDMTYSLIIPNMLIIVGTCLLHLQMRGVVFSKVSQNSGRVNFSHKKGGIVKIGRVKIVALRKQSPPFDVRDHTWTPQYMCH